VHTKLPARTKKNTSKPRRKMIVARIDAADYKRLSQIARSNNRSVSGEIKHQLEQLLAA
jgi:hypothetical protein